MRNRLATGNTSTERDELCERLDDRNPRSLDAAQYRKLLLCAHADVPATPYMPRLFLYFIVSRTDSASAFFSVEFSSFKTRTSSVVASR